MATVVRLVWWSLRRRQGHLYTASVDKLTTSILSENQARTQGTNIRGPRNSQMYDVQSISYGEELWAACSLHTVAFSKKPLFFSPD
jgi:hypothetical protein